MASFLFQLYGEGLRSLTQKLNKLSGGDAFTNATAQNLGDNIVGEMRDLISKGISPIRQVGRFPEYLAVGRGRAAKKQLKAAKKTNPSLKGAKVNAQDAAFGYPFTVKKKFPDKRERPVNLYLSGNFMKQLRAKVSKDGADWLITIGWDSDKQRVKELGHREGAKGQPERPIIPVGSEQWAVSINQIIQDAVNRAWLG